MLFKVLEVFVFLHQSTPQSVFCQYVTEGAALFTSKAFEG